MLNYREIMRLRSLGYNITEIANSLHSSRSTIREVLSRFEKNGATWPLDDAITNEKLYEQLYPERKEKIKQYKEPDFDWIHSELSRKGVNLSLLWKEYQAKCRLSNEIPYMYTQFCEHYRSWAGKNKATMRIHHKPGDAMMVDWAGGTLTITDSYTGIQTEGYLFVAALPCSGYVYVELCSDMKIENWLACHTNAYSFFEGVPRLLIPDNLRTGITKNTRLETIINKSYSELASYYDTAIVPARVKAPKDKSAVEGSVKFASTWILAALRNQTFLSLNDAKIAVKERLIELNNQPFQKREGSRKSAFIQEEKAFLQPLPSTPFELATWSKAKVSSAYIVSDGRNHYSVPYNLIGETVDIRTTREMVEILFHGARVASHIRLNYQVKDPIVKKEHMPMKHQKYLAYDKADFIKWGASIGPNTERVVQSFLSAGLAPEQGYKPCVSLMSLSKKYSKDKIEQVCLECLSFNETPSIRSISLLLKDLPPSNISKTSNLINSSPGITRGSKQFQKEGDVNA